MSNNSEKFKKTMLWATILLALILPFFYAKPLFLMLFTLIYYIFILSFFNQKLALFLLIFIRPCLDLLTGESLFSYGKVSINFAAIFGAFVLIFAFIMTIRNVKEINKAPLIYPWVLFLFGAFVGILFSSNISISGKEWMRLLSIFSIYILSYSIIKNKEDLITLVKVIILSTLIPAAFAIYQFQTETGMSIPFEGIYNRIFGTFAHPNLFAYYLVLPIVLSIAIFIIGNKKILSNILTFPYLILLFYLLVFTYTRGAWMAFFISVLVISLIKSRGLLIILLAVFFSFYIVVEPINTRINDLNRQDQNSSVQWRMRLWEDSIGYVKQKPFTGYGTGMSNEVILKNRGAEFGSSDPHNDYLKILLENGVIGLALYLNLIYFLIKYIWSKYKNLNKPKIKIFTLIIFSYTIAIYIMSFADNIIRNTALEWSFWMLIGAIMASVVPSKTLSQT